MPTLGEIKQNKGENKQIWQACPDCGRETWIYLKNGKPRSIRCHTCHMRQVTRNQKNEGHPQWKGGRHLHPDGYILVKLKPDSLFYPMASAKGYITEHRLIVAKFLNRCLKTHELVHHKNGIRDDNRLDNLEIVQRNNHNGEIQCPQCLYMFKIK